MNEATFVGIKNHSGGVKKAQFGGDVTVFEKDEIKVVPVEFGMFLLSRRVTGTKEIEGVGKRLTLSAPFKQIPLQEALKYVKEPENQSIAEAKAAMKHEEELEAKIKADLIAAGWSPKKAEEPKKAAAKL